MIDIPWIACRSAWTLIDESPVIIFSFRVLHVFQYLLGDNGQHKAQNSW